MKFLVPSYIKNDYNGFQFFLTLYDCCKNIKQENIILDFIRTSWFDANLTAVLGSILAEVIFNLNSIKLENISDNIRTILKRNHFLSHYGEDVLIDNYSSTIKYKKFKPTDYKLFNNYLAEELISQKVFDTISTRLSKRIKESIFEIYYNAVLHSDCQNIFTCGQYYYVNKKLDFTIVDIGRTIKENVNHYLYDNLSGIEAIKWAVKGGNTTKFKNIPGGLGLKLIREFVRINKGKLQIISADGFWMQTADKTTGQSFNLEFPGTIVNLEFNISDDFYYIKNEIEQVELF